MQPSIAKVLQLANQGRFTQAVAQWRRTRVSGDQSEYLALGGQLHAQLNQPGEARRLFEQALGANRNNMTAIMGLAQLERSDGHFDAALALYRRARRLQPQHPAVAMALALCLKDADQVDEAVQVMAPLARNTTDPQIQYNFGNLLLAADRPAEAEAAFRKALAKAAKNPAVHNGLGLALLACDRTSEAADSFERAVRIDSRGVPAWNNLGRIRFAEGDLAGAEKAWNASLNASPGQVEVCNLLANLYRDSGRWQEAQALLEQTIEKFASDPSAYLNLAALLEERHQLERAEQVGARGLKIAPDNVELLLLQARLHRRGGRVQHALKILRELSCDDPAEEGRRLHELALVCDRLGRHDEAWRAIEQRQALTDRPISPSPHLDLLGAYSETGGASLVERQTQETRPATSQTPLFLVGFPRSGTTLLGRILGSHPNVTELEEKPFLGDVALGLSGWPRQPLTADEVEDARNRYLAVIENYPGSGVILDRNPANLMHVPLIHSLWPEARILVMVRHPLDVVLSCVMQDFRRNWLTQHLGSIGGAANLYRQMMGLWMNWRGDARCLEIRYEDLASEPEATVGRVTQFANLGACDPADLIHRRLAAVPSTTASYHQVVQPITADATDRWQHYARQLRTIDHGLDDLIDALGYRQSEQKRQQGR